MQLDAELFGVVGSESDPATAIGKYCFACPSDPTEICSPQFLGSDPDPELTEKCYLES